MNKSRNNFAEQVRAHPRRTIANKEVLALIAPLSKLNVIHKLGKISAAASKWPSLASGAIRATTSWSAVVFLGSSF